VRAEETLARHKADEARKLQAYYDSIRDPEPTPPDPEIYTTYLWRGEKIPIPRYGIGGAGEAEKVFEKAAKEEHERAKLTGRWRYPWDEEPGEE
jgi:hypothetical protein